MRSARFVLLSLSILTFPLSFGSAAFAAACSAPATANTVAVCSPLNNASIQGVQGTVEVSAAANVAGLTLLRVYDNHVPLYETKMSSFDTVIYVGSGLHSLSVVAYNGSGSAFQQQVAYSVTDGSAGQPCGIPQTDATINFCFPTDQLTVGSPVVISALARWDCCSITHIRLYEDHAAVYDADHQNNIFAYFSAAPGPHTFSAIAWNNQGQFIKSSVNVTVVDTSCTPQTGVMFCWPNATVPSPVQIIAGASIPGFKKMILYDNDMKIDASGPVLNASYAVGQGLHHFALVAFDSNGNTYKAYRDIRVTTPGPREACGRPETTQDVNICSPVEFQTFTTDASGFQPLVTVTARARWSGHPIMHIRAYVDGQLWYDDHSQSWVDFATRGIASGKHKLTITVWDPNGATTSASRTFFVQ